MLVTSIFSFSHNVFKMLLFKIDSLAIKVGILLERVTRPLGYKAFDGIENIVGKRRKCCLAAFTPFPILFSKTTFLGLPKQALVFTCLRYKSFENTVGNGEIARNEQFLLFPQCFLTVWITFCIFIKFEIVLCKLFQFGRI